MAVLRFLSAFFLLIATIALVSDATPPLSGGGPFVGTAFLDHWKAIAPGSLEAAKAALLNSSVPWVWNDVVAVVTGFPTFVTFGVLALLCGYGGRRRREINIYVN